MIDFSKIEGKKHIWVSLSGGVDSALLMYLIVQHLYTNNSTAKVTPWCLVDLERPGNDLDAQKIIDCIYNMYPYQHIQPMQGGSFRKPPGGDKVKLSMPFWENMAATGEYDMFTSALSASPTIDQMKSIEGFYESFLLLTSEDRNPANEKQEFYDSKIAAWFPFINIDKKAIANKYEEQDLMFSLFPLTKSCVDREFTPCKKCFWCHEKKWAFGLYDVYGGKVIPK